MDEKSDSNFDELAESEQLHLLSHKLFTNKKQLQEFHKQLAVAQQQLKAEQQQLRAASQQLKAANQQLIAANQKLKNTEQELRQSKQLYEMLFDGTIEGIAVYEAVNEGNDFIFKKFNPAAEKIDGIKKQQVLGKSVLEVFPGVKEFGLFDVFQRVWRTGRPEHHPVSLYKDERIIGWRENYVFKLPTGQIVAVYADITESKRAEEALRESEERFRTIFAQSPVGIEIYDASGKLIDANPACLEMFGVENVEAVRGFDLMADPNVPPEARIHLEQGETIKYETVFDFELVQQQALYRTSRSGQFFAGCLIVPLRALDYSITGYLVHVRDITERKKAEDSLRDSEQRFRQIFGGAPISIWDEDFTAVSEWLEGLRRHGVRDLDAFLQQEPQALEHALSLVRLVDVNDTTLRLFEVDSKEKLLRIWSKLFTEDTFEVFREEVRAIWEGRDRVDCECSAHTAGGRSIHYQMHWVAPLEDGRLNLGRVIVALADITDQKRMEQALRESEARLRSFQEAATDGLMVFDSRLDLTDINKAALDILGMNKRDMIGKNILEISPDVKTTGRYDKYLEVLRAGKPCFIDDVVLHPKFRDRHLSLRIFKVGDGLGIIGTDITEQKKAEQALKEAHDKLEQKVKERTAQLVQASLQLQKETTERMRKEEMLINSERLAALGSLAANIAHEINNPLAGIKNSFLLIKDSIPDSHPYYKYVGLIEKEIERVSNIIRQMYDLYRPVEAQKRKFHLHEAVSDVVALLEAASEEHKVDVSIDIDENIVVELPDSLLRQVLFNIIQNAIEASHSHSKVRVSGEICEGVLDMRIIDTGVGIPKDIREKIFEPFFTSKHDNVKRSLGLGLSVCKNIIDAIGGEITVQSRAGKGTTFTIKIPLKDSNAKQDNG